MAIMKDLKKAEELLKDEMHMSGAPGPSAQLKEVLETIQDTEKKAVEHQRVYESI